MNKQVSEKKSQEMTAKYGDLALKVAQEVLNNIPLTHNNNRDIWIGIIKELTPKTKTDDPSN